MKPAPSTTNENAATFEVKNRVTLRDIASAAGVHYSTISMALRDHPRISLRTREKIKELARQMGYSPDPALSALNAYRKTKLPVHYQSTLIWIDNWKGSMRARKIVTFDEYFQGASSRARQLGYEVEEFSLSQEKVNPEQATRILKSRGIKGLLLAPQPTSGTKLPINYQLFSTVAFGYSLEPRDFNLVTNHQVHSMNLAMTKLTELGYKRIGLYFHEDQDEKVDNSYTGSHWIFSHKHPHIQSIKPGLSKTSNRREEKKFFLAWFLKNKPDVIISGGGTPIEEWLLEINLEVPLDIGLALLSVADDDPHYSGIYQNGFLIGKTAVDFLIGNLQRGEFGPPEVPIRILVEGSWRPGVTAPGPGRRN